jgi:uncharacterized protein (DUF302 family)
MVASPGVAIDLPLKALVWQEDNGKVWLSLQRPELSERAAQYPGQSTAKYRRHRTHLLRSGTLSLGTAGKTFRVVVALF